VDELLGLLLLTLNVLLLAALLTSLDLLLAALALGFLASLTVREADVHVDLLIGRGVRLKGGNEGLVRLEATDLIEVRVGLDVLDVIPSGSNGLLEVLDSLVGIAKKGLNASEVVEGGDTMEGAGVSLLNQELTSLLKVLGSLGLHGLHGLLMKTEPLLAALPWVGNILGTSAVGMKVKRALSALVRSALTSELAPVADEVTMTIRSRSQIELVDVTIVLASLGEVSKVLRRALSERGAATARTGTTMGMAATTSPPRTTKTPTTAAFTFLATAVLLGSIRGLLQVEAKDRGLFVTRQIECLSKLLVG
jgi:hypothetical protein